jgi:hypothetical protein
MKKLLKQIENLQQQAAEYAEVGRMFPTFGFNNIVDQLGEMQTRAAKLAKKEAERKADDLAFDDISSASPTKPAKKKAKKK